MEELDGELSIFMGHICCYSEEDVNALLNRVRAEAWDHGVREGKRLGEWGLPGLPNPYREKDK